MTEVEVRELVGELLVAGFDGLEPTDHAKRLIDQHRVKNIILFRRNVESVEQVTQLNESLQAMAKESGHSQPLIICTDQENGIVRRVAPGAPGLPGNMAIGATQNADNAYVVGRLTGRQLRSMGLNMDLAPVLDVNNNPENPVIGVRSYGEDAEFVARLGAEMIRGLQETGVIACAKHFPGHGDTSVDSHLALPEVSHSLERLYGVELKPFQKAIEIGVDAIMTAHIVFSSIEPGRPATLSHRVLTDFLRTELGYEGVVTTDCLEMNAISGTVGVAEGAVQALLAGADMLMVSHRLDRQEAAIEAVVAAVLAGRIPEQRLMQATTRIRMLRENRVSAVRETSPATTSLLAESESLSKRLCEQAATLVSNEDDLLPIDPDAVRNIDVLVDTGGTRMSASDNVSSHAFILNALGVAVPQAEIRLHRVSDEQRPPSFEELKNSGLIVVGLNGTPSSTYVAYVSRLSEAGLPVVALALQSPYDLLAVPQLKARVAVYEYTPWMVEAGVKALFGIGGTGRLPVTLQ